MKTNKKAVRKKHRHKWQQDYIDCPFCGGRETFSCCDCGEVRDKESKLI